MTAFITSSIGGTDPAVRVKIGCSGVEVNTRMSAFSEALYHELGPKGVLVTSVNPGFSPTEGFPATGPSIVRLHPDDVAKLIVDVVRKGTAPEISIPRTLAALQAFRVLTPPLYRRGLGTISRRYGSSGSAER